MPIVVKNNAYSTIAAGLAAGDTTFSVASTTGSRFPTLSVGDYFYAVLEDVNHNIEIIKVTARTGDLMTITRAQEGTTARSFASGSAFELRLTAQTITDLVGNSTVTKDSPTGAAALPAGTTAQRPASPQPGYTRVNTDTGLEEWWTGSTWASSGTGSGGATGGGTDKVLYENDQTVTTSYTLTAGKNALSAGPVTVNSGVTVTVPAGSVWTIVGG